jgi:phage portal protein BeeE
MFLSHVVHTLMPWYERIQQSAEVNLLTKADRAAGYYIKLHEAGLLRGAMKDTSEYLYRLTTAGVMERNEARAKLDLNPLVGLDDPLTPLNMTTDPAGFGAQTGGSNA